MGNFLILIKFLFKKNLIIYLFICKFLIFIGNNFRRQGTN